MLGSVLKELRDQTRVMKTPIRFRLSAWGCVQGFAGAFLCATLIGCASPGAVEQDLGELTPEETLYVLGVSPDYHRVRISAGEVVDGIFKPDEWAFTSRAYGGPTGGYLVWKGLASDTAAITSVRYLSRNPNIAAADFVTCGEVRTMVFRSGQSGSVVYLGDVSYELKGSTLHKRYGTEFARAREYIERRFPQLKDKVVQGAYELLPTSRSCR